MQSKAYVTKGSRATWKIVVNCGRFFAAIRYLHLKNTRPILNLRHLKKETHYINLEELLAVHSFFYWVIVVSVELYQIQA